MRRFEGEKVKDQYLGEKQAQKLSMSVTQMSDFTDEDFKAFIMNMLKEI